MVKMRDIGLFDLLADCAAASQRGDDFPKIWNTILKKHPLVAGIPVQSHRQGEPLLEIPLINGRRLVFDNASFTLA
jgi:hypothetical protein